MLSFASDDIHHMSARLIPSPKSSVTSVDRGSLILTLNGHGHGPEVRGAVNVPLYVAGGLRRKGLVAVVRVIVVVVVVAGAVVSVGVFLFAAGDVEGVLGLLQPVFETLFEPFSGLVEEAAHGGSG